MIDGTIEWLDSDMLVFGRKQEGSRRRAGLGNNCWRGDY